MCAQLERVYARRRLISYYIKYHNKKEKKTLIDKRESIVYFVQFSEAGQIFKIF